jgi:hypothetical protein
MVMPGLPLKQPDRKQAAARPAKTRAMPQKYSHRRWLSPGVLQQFTLFN